VMDQDHLYTGPPVSGRVHWTALGAGEVCNCGADFHQDPGRPPAIEQQRPFTEHRYPRPKQPRVRNRADSHWTIGDALRFLDPAPPRRTVSRWLRSIEPVGERALKQGGPPARTYPARSIMERHAVWASKGAKR
jgi:hypothetical protein